MHDAVAKCGFSGSAVGVAILITESISSIDIDLVSLSFLFALTVQNEEFLQPLKWIDPWGCWSSVLLPCGDF